MKVRYIFLVGLFGSLIGCSGQVVKRAGYETLQNIRDIQCEKDLTADCPERESYEAYQRKLQDMESSKQQMERSN